MSFRIYRLQSRDGVTARHFTPFADGAYTVKYVDTVPLYMKSSTVEDNIRTAAWRTIFVSSTLGDDDVRRTAADMYRMSVLGRAMADDLSSGGMRVFPSMPWTNGRDLKARDGLRQVRFHVEGGSMYHKLGWGLSFKACVRDYPELSRCEEPIVLDDLKIRSCAVSAPACVGGFQEGAPNCPVAPEEARRILAALSTFAKRHLAGAERQLYRDMAGDVESAPVSSIFRIQDGDGGLRSVTLHGRGIIRAK